MIHTSALHIRGSLVVCVCGEIFVDPNTPRADTYIVDFSRHLTRMNAGS